MPARLDVSSDIHASQSQASVSLASIPAEFISQARRQLPPLQPGAACAAGDITIGTPWNLGEVRIWFEVYLPPASQRRRGVPGFWTPVRAERVQHQATPDPSHPSRPD